MARPIKKGLDYFPLDVDFFEKEEIKFFSVECGSSGICALVKLMCNIYRNGYYMAWGDDHEALFSWDMRGMVSREEVPHIIEVCLKRGIFSRNLYKKYKILTSQYIQEVFLQALDGKRRIDIIKEYWIIKTPEKANINSINGNETAVKDNKTQDKEVECVLVENKFIPPTVEDVERYFEENGYTKEAARKAYNYYAVAEWKDGRGKKVNAWKQKMISVWFKDENLKIEKNGISRQVITF